MLIAGFDIGGTKCSVILADVKGEKIDFISRDEIPTEGNWKTIIDTLIEKISGSLHRFGLKQEDIKKAGISCGGPLDSKKGMIMSPPNLKGWDNVPICSYISEKLNVSASLMNDADACAVAEWKFGAGRGYENIIFLTFGTGLGAGLILNGRLYTGTNNMAGEVGHIRLSSEGPVGYGKRGSFEGFCSGGGIAQQAKTYFTEKLQMGLKCPLCPDFETVKELTAKDIVLAADRGDEDAIEILDRTGRYFGLGLSVLIDILNPEIIIAGGVFMRGHKHIEKSMAEVLEKEALALSLKHCKIVPSELNEKIGDYGAISAALCGLRHRGVQADLRHNVRGI